jgi:hypothetical protein
MKGKDDASKSRKRPAAVAKAKAAARRAPAADDDLGFVESPWATWRRASQDARADRTALAVLEHSPFRIGEGAWTSLAQMAREAGRTIAEAAEANNWLESRGYLLWDRASQSAVPVIPADS